MQHETKHATKEKLKIPDDLTYLDFGCGSGQSMQFANSILRGIGHGLDASPEAVANAQLRGYNASVADICNFEGRNLATASFAIDVLPELQGRAVFEKALSNIVRSARNFSCIQHIYFDMDPELARAGLQISGSFDKRVRFKPTTADYIHFVSKNRAALNIVGLGIFCLGRPTLAKLELTTNDLTTLPEPETWPLLGRSLRVIIGRREVSRFRASLEKLATGQTILVWEDGNQS